MTVLFLRPRDERTYTEPKTSESDQQRCAGDDRLTPLFFALTLLLQGTHRALRKQKVTPGVR